MLTDNSNCLGYTQGDYSHVKHIGHVPGFSQVSCA